VQNISSFKVYQTDVRDYMLANYPNMSIYFRGFHACPFTLNRFHCAPTCQLLNDEGWKGLSVSVCLLFMKFNQFQFHGGWPSVKTVLYCAHYAKYINAVEFDNEEGVVEGPKYDFCKKCFLIKRLFIICKK
jgi:hypothetical protein